MADIEGVDPFAARSGTVGHLAARLRCTEGRVYTTAIGMVVALVLSVTALPDVVWRIEDVTEAGLPIQAGPTTTQPPGAAPETSSMTTPTSGRVPLPPLPAAVPDIGGPTPTTPPTAAVPSSTSVPPDPSPPAPPTDPESCDAAPVIAALQLIAAAVGASQASEITGLLSMALGCEQSTRRGRSGRTVHQPLGEGKR